MTKKKKIIILSSSIALGAALIALLITLLSVSSVNSNTKEELYQKGLTHLINQEYKDATEVFADNLLIGYKDSEKKYCYSYDLLKYEQHTFEYEDLIDYGLSEPNSLAIVDFVTDGGTAVPRKTISAKATIPYITEKSSKDNYDFLSWSLNYASYDKDNDAIRYILKANFDNHYFKIDYDFAGGQTETVAPSHYQYDKGDVSIPNSVKTGYIFDGYESNLYEEAKVNFVIPNGTAKDLSLTATYHAKTVHVTFNAYPAIVTDEYDVEYDSDVTSYFPVPVRSYYNFDGWYDGSTKVNLEKFNIDHDVELHAKYSPTSYNISYQLGGGTPASELPETYSFESGPSIKFPYVEQPGKVFVGWTGGSVTDPVINYHLPTIDLDDIELTANYVDATIDANNKLQSIADTSIKEFVVPSFVTKVDSTLLSTLPNLQSIFVDERNSHYLVDDQLLVEEGHIAMGYPVKHYESSLVVSIPTYIDEIGDYAFKGTPITTVNGYHAISKVGMESFKGCSSLTTVNLNGVTTVGYEAFKESKLGDGFFANNKLTLSSIGNGAFSNTSITSIDIQNTVTHIGNEAFANCYYADDLIFHPNKECEIGENIFDGCTALKNVETDLTYLNTLLSTSLDGVPVETIKVIGLGIIKENTFKDLTSLESVDLSEASISRIKGHAFDGCTSLEDVDLSSQTNLILIEGYAFNNTAITSVDISKNAHLTLEDHAFNECTDLTTVKMRHGQIVTRMGDVFSMCGKINNIEYVIGQTSSEKVIIPDFLFKNLNSVTSITIKYEGTDVASKEVVFGTGAFQGDSGLVDVTLVNCHVTSLPSYCFDGCTSFKNTSGSFSNLTSYGDGAFFSCTQLDNMTITGTTSIGSFAFGGCYSLCNNSPFLIPSTVANLGEEAFTDIVGEIDIDLPVDAVNTLKQAGGPWDHFDAGFAGVIKYQGEF